MKPHTWIDDTLPDSGGWKGRHMRSVYAHRGIAEGLRGWCDYGIMHEARLGSPIGKDYALGPLWAEWGYALRGLLCGELDGLDAGTIDTIIYDNLREQGFDPDNQ